VAGTWLALAVVMSANGAFREMVLRRAVGSAADIISAVLGIGIIVLITRSLLRVTSPLPISRVLVASALLVALTVAFEFLFGHYVDGKSWSELAANYAFWKGRLWPFVLLTIALMPFVWGRWLTRGRDDRRATHQRSSA
jgi:hypothetical protein